jgi:hypothetical protein
MNIHWDKAILGENINNKIINCRSILFITLQLLIFTLILIHAFHFGEAFSVPLPNTNPRSPPNCAAFFLSKK